MPRIRSRILTTLNATPQLWMILAAICFAMMGGFAKGARGVNSWELTFFRALLNAIWLLPWIVANPEKCRVPRKELRTLAIRSLAGCTAVTLYFFALQRISLAEVSMLNHTSPVLVTLLSALLLGEAVSRERVAWVGVAFVGVALILRPSPSFFSGGAKAVGSLAGLASAFAASIGYVAIKMATRMIHPRVIVATFAIVAASLTALPTIYTFHLPTAKVAWMLFGTAAMGTIAQESMTRGYVLLPASVASPILMSTVVFSAILGWVVFGEVPDAYAILGGIFVAIGLFGAQRKGSRPL